MRGRLPRLHYLFLFAILVVCVISLGVSVWTLIKLYTGVQTSATVSAIKEKTKISTAIANAVKLTSSSYYLGERIAKNQKKVQGYLFLYNITEKKEELAKKSESPALPLGSCYAMIGNKARWQSAAKYGVDPSNNQGLSPTFIYTAIANAVNVWNSVNPDFTMLGNRDSTIVVDGPDLNSPDGKNEWMFGSIDMEGILAYTSLWGTFSGSNQEVIEWDQVYNDDDYNWGDATVNSNLVDLENICAHELGHSLALADLYNDICNDATMYGYASGGETKKRTLTDGDINGICEIYDCDGGGGGSSGSGGSPNSGSTFQFPWSLVLLILIVMTL